MNFIITGGAGFIGSHLTELLLSEGHQVTVVDDFSTGRLSNLPLHPRLKLIDRSIEHCTPKDFPLPIHGVAHLAATPSVVDSWRHPLNSHHNNLSSILQILSLVKALEIPRLVFASSAAVYGNSNRSIICETDDPHPISPYGLQKLVSEQYASLFAHQIGFSFIALRLFNVYGPRQLPESPYSGVISVFTSAMQNGQPITLFGNGSQTRDFIYVQDVANAFLKALTVPLPEVSCLSINIGTGQSTSLIELLKILESHFPAWKSEVHIAEPRIGDIQHSTADVSRALTVLDFIPQWSIRMGISQLVRSLAQSARI